MSLEDNRTGCRAVHMGLQGSKLQETGENYIMESLYVRRLFSAMRHGIIWQKFADTLEEPVLSILKTYDLPSAPWATINEVTILEMGVAILGEISAHVNQPTFNIQEDGTRKNHHQRGENFKPHINSLLCVFLFLGTFA